MEDYPLFICKYHEKKLEDFFKGLIVPLCSHDYSLVVLRKALKFDMHRILNSFEEYVGYLEKGQKIYFSEETICLENGFPYSISRDETKKGDTYDKFLEFVEKMRKVVPNYLLMLCDKENYLGDESREGVYILEVNPFFKSHSRTNRGGY